MRPRPMMPTVFSKSSTPVYVARFHSPALRLACAAGMWRARLRMWPMVSSAALMMLEVGALTTMTPAVVAALMSTLSRPTPARATTFSCFAAASASASIWVAERMSTACASGIAASSAARSVPSTLRMSKSGPRASTVAGESSSAIRTIGLATGVPSGSGGRWPQGRRRGEHWRGCCEPSELARVCRRATLRPRSDWSACRQHQDARALRRSATARRSCREPPRKSAPGRTAGGVA